MLTAKDRTAVKRHRNGCICCQHLNPISKINTYRIFLLTISYYSRDTIIFTIARKRVLLQGKKKKKNLTQKLKQALIFHYKTEPWLSQYNYQNPRFVVYLRQRQVRTRILRSDYYLPESRSTACTVGCLMYLTYSAQENCLRGRAQQSINSQEIKQLAI